MNQTYSQARQLKDKSFDGQFLFAVKTTGIFCRPSCPSPIAKEDNVIYFEQVYEALEQGFRPCHRCRPDLALENIYTQVPGAFRVQKALDKIHDGYLNYHSIQELAQSVFVSERQLRKLFVKHLGVAPIKIAKYHKALFAKKLVVFSTQSLTEIAFASGFNSIRQFNSVFKEVFGDSPSMIRGALLEKHAATDGSVLSLKYDPSFHFKSVLAFLRPRAIEGIEIVTEEAYYRTFHTEEARGFLKVTDCRAESALQLQIQTDDIRCYMMIYNKVRKLFDLDRDFSKVTRRFKEDVLLKKGLEKGQVPRLPVAFNAFEFVVRAIIGQQVSVKAASTVTARLVEKADLKTDGHFPDELRYFFPPPEVLLDLELEGIGLTQSKQLTIKAVSKAVVMKKLQLTPNQSFESFYQAFSSIKGIGDWTINYVAMRALGMKDCFPASDLGIINALSQILGQKPDLKAIQQLAEQWHPYRAYAALCLWNQYNPKN